MFRRNLTGPIMEALADTPVVMVRGARQTGKSTLARSVARSIPAARYLSLDDLSILAAARADPAGFVEGHPGLVVIDEAQRVPDLFLAMKAEVDRDRRPGRFLLTGSADPFALPRLSDTLAGRVEILDLWPLSQGEMSDLKEGLLDALFSPAFVDTATAAVERDAGDPLVLALAGGFPEAVARTRPARRRAWFESYVQTILLREVRDLANIAGLAGLPRLLALAAARAGGLLNRAAMARDAGLNAMTFHRYLALLEAVFLVRAIRPWFTNRMKRLVKSEKLYLCDTGLLAHLLDLSPERLARDPSAAGPLFENLVAQEIMKQMAWCEVRAGLYHMRDQAGAEVDFVLEAPDGRLVGVEAKAAMTVGPGDFKGLKTLADAMKDRFIRGVVLYRGRHVVRFASNLHAVPVEALWRVTIDY